MIDIRALNEGESVEFSEAPALDVPKAYGIIGDKAVVSVKGKALRHGDDYSVLAVCETAYQLECARCLKPVAQTLAFPLEERFRDAPEYNNDVDAWPLAGHSIELKPAVESAFYSLIPQKVLCEEDCAGLTN